MVNCQGNRLSGVDIFLSYARVDRDAARVFADSFVQEGFTVWWDASLHSGETFDEVIEQNLRDSKAVVVLWSPRSVASRWVRAEATQADRKNKLVPAIIEPCDRPIIFELTHAAELAGWTGDMTDSRWRMFITDLRRMVERHHGTTETPAAKPHPSPAAETSAQPAARRPIRPGSDEVIFAGRKAEEPAERPQRAAQVSAAAEPDPHAEVHCLEVEDEELGAELFVIESSGLKVGRVAPADIVLPHRSVSREHCVIGLANDELLVTDLNSTNGTFIDGERVERSSVLPVGSELRVGQVSLMHSIRTRAEAAWLNSLGDTDTDGPVQPGRIAAAR